MFDFMTIRILTHPSEQNFVFDALLFKWTTGSGKLITIINAERNNSLIGAIFNEMWSVAVEGLLLVTYDMW